MDWIQEGKKSEKEKIITEKWEFNSLKSATLVMIIVNIY